MAVKVNSKEYTLKQIPNKFKNEVIEELKSFNKNN